MRRARRASFGASLSYCSALSANVLGVAASPEVLEELELRARLERVAYHALRRDELHR